MKNLTGLCLLMLVALFSGCAKTANDIAEIKAEHQKSIAALNEKVDKLALTVEHRVTKVEERTGLIALVAAFLGAMAGRLKD